VTPLKPLRCAALDLLIKDITAALDPDAAMGGLVEGAQRVRERADLVRSHLQFLLSDPDRLAGAAKGAYVHVNGFVKVKLFECKDFSLRLHIWPAGENRRGDIEPHSHRWDFASWVAVGRGLLERYWRTTGEQDPHGVVHFEYRYEPRSEAPVRAQDITVLRSVEQWERIAGTVYDCPVTALHTVVPVGTDLIATIVLQGPTLADSTTVYRPAGSLCTNHKEPITSIELGGLFEAVGAAVTAAGVD
jgi:hypothetical protein